MPRKKAKTQSGGWVGPALMGASMLAPHILGGGKSGGKRGKSRGLISNGLSLAGTLSGDKHLKSAGYAAKMLGLGKGKGQGQGQSGKGVKSTLSKAKSVATSTAKKEAKKIAPAIKRQVVKQVKREIFGGGLRRPQ